MYVVPMHECLLYHGDADGALHRVAASRFFCQCPHVAPLTAHALFVINITWAEKFGLPIVTFIDTPGAFAGKTAEELGQGEAIAYNLREMFGLKVPVFSVVLGEGGSGGALAIGVANRNLILGNAVFYVASPEACAAILWKDRSRVGDAADALGITGEALCKLDIMDEIIPEPLGGAHRFPLETAANIKKAILDNWKVYSQMSLDEVLSDRFVKSQKVGPKYDFWITGGDAALSVERRKAAWEITGGFVTKHGRWVENEAEKVYYEDVDEKLIKFEEKVAQMKNVVPPEKHISERTQVGEKAMERAYWRHPMPGEEYADPRTIGKDVSPGNNF